MVRNNKLEIFEDFWIDKSLKKKPENNVAGAMGSSEFGVANPEVDRDINTSRIWINPTQMDRHDRSNSETFGDVQLIEYLKYKYQQNGTILNWLKLKLASVLSVERQERLMKGKIRYETVDMFFSNIKRAVATLKIDPTSIEFYTNAIQTAIQNGQTALSEILATKRKTVLRELNLLKLEITKYVDEEDVVRFYLLKKIPGKYLKLTWLGNYTRVIPKDIVELKHEFDDKEAFDNYVVLHFDKNNDASEMTEKQKAKAKDPILFGVIQGSSKLYYVGDWTDDYCDLTLAEFLKALEQERIKELSQQSIEKEILS